VREAIRRLQGIQLVTREPYFRARVVTLSQEAVIELLQTLRRWKASHAGLRPSA